MLANLWRVNDLVDLQIEEKRSERRKAARSTGVEPPIAILHGRALVTATDTAATDQRIKGPLNARARGTK
jgi:hypothetical protein